MAEEPKPLPPKKKYGIFPPLRTVRNGRLIGTIIEPGCSMEEWEQQRHKALEELIATFTPEELAEFNKNMAANQAEQKRAMYRSYQPAKKKKKKKS